MKSRLLTPNSKKFYLKAANFESINKISYHFFVSGSNSHFQERGLHKARDSLS